MGDINIVNQTNNILIKKVQIVQMVLKFDEIIYLKKLILEKYNKNLHMHDTCGGQYFSFDTKLDGIENFVNEYLSQYNMSAKFSQDGLSFTVE